MRFGPGPGPVVLREPLFDIARALPAYAPPADAPDLPARALATGTEFPPRWPVWDQGDHESCTANAAAAVLMHLLLREAGGGTFRAPEVDDPAVSRSRDFLWYENQRTMRELGENAGVWVRIAIRNLQRFGGCPDAAWKALPERFQDYEQWTPRMQADLRALGILDLAAAERPLRALHLASDVFDPRASDDHANAPPRDIEPLKRCLQEGYPFVMALAWYDRFEPRASSLPEGDFPLPAPDGTATGAGHTVTVVGYDDEFTSPDGDHRGPRWLVRDSKGADTGHEGYVSLPYEWATNPYYSHGLWTLRRAAEGEEEATP